MKKNNTAEKTILDAEKISKALKESTEKSLRSMLNEAISNIVSEDDDEDDDKEDSYEVEDVTTTETPAVKDETSEESKDDVDTAEDDTEVDTDTIGDVEDNEEGSDDESDEVDDDEWSDMEQYKVGDNDYDFTGVDGDEILKVYHKLGDDDQIFVKKEDDGTYSVKDDETGAEFVIELDPEVLGDEADDETEDFDVEFDSDLSSDDDADEDEISIEPDEDKVEIELDSDDDVDDEEEKEEDAEEKIDDEDSENLTESDEVSGEETELDESDTISSRDARHTVKTKIKQHRPNAPEYAVRKVDSPMNESIKKIINKAKEIQAENKQYKDCINKIKTSLYEAAVLNVNLGKLVDILVNETTTKDEKKHICERFNNVKTIAEGKTLYNTIKTELHENKKSSPVVEKQFVAESKNLNETTIYQNTNDPSLDLMNRMDNLFR